MDRVGREARSCATCASGCCRSFEEIVLTRADVAALGERLAAVAPHVVYLPDGAHPEEIAVLTLGLREGVRECVFLRADGCSVYEDRPTACRRYGVEHCEGIYVRDPLKIEGKVHLRVR